MGKYAKTTPSLGTHWSIRYRHGNSLWGVGCKTSELHSNGASNLSTFDRIHQGYDVANPQLWVNRKYHSLYDFGTDCTDLAPNNWNAAGFISICIPFIRELEKLICSVALEASRNHNITDKWTPYCSFPISREPVLLPPRFTIYGKSTVNGQQGFTVCEIR